MKQPIVVILGGNILNSGIVDYCKQKGYFVVVVDWSPNAALKGNLFFCIDVKDSAAIIDSLENHGVHSILGAYSSIDLAVPSVNAINAHYGLKTMDKEALSHALRKSVMTQIWDECGLLNRFSKVFISFEHDIFELNVRMNLIFKPNVSSSSRGITIIPKGSSSEDIESAYYKAQEESFDKNVIIEEFIQGQEFTCEMLGDAMGNVSVYAISVKYHTQNTKKNKIAIKLHYNSSFYPDDLYERIAAFGKRCYRALGFHASFGHLELILKDDGLLSPIEIGARSSGFITNPLVSKASGKDFFGDYLSVLHGKTITGEDYINGEQSSMYFFYDMPHNTRCKKPSCLVNFLSNGIDSLYSNRNKLQTKDFVYANIANDNERIGYEILIGNRDILTIQHVEKAEQEFINYNTND